MAILTPKQKRLRIFVYAFFIILIITGLVIYFGFIRQPEAGPTILTSTSPSPAQELVKKISIDWDFLESEIIQELRFFGEHPVKPGETGRENPFLPI